MAAPQVVVVNGVHRKVAQRGLSALSLMRLSNLRGSRLLPTYHEGSAGCFVFSTTLAVPHDNASIPEHHGPYGNSTCLVSLRVTAPRHVGWLQSQFCVCSDSVFVQRATPVENEMRLSSLVLFDPLTRAAHRGDVLRCSNVGRDKRPHPNCVY